MPIGFIPPMLQVLEDRRVTPGETSWLTQELMAVIITAVITTAFWKIVGKSLEEPEEELELLPASIPAKDLRRIADEYGWWVARLAKDLCLHNDVACVEREAKRLFQSRSKG